MELNLPDVALDEYLDDGQLTPSDPVLEQTESFELFEHGPLEDFSFAEAGDYRRIALADCIHLALQESPVVRELGGLILRFPDTIATQFDPSATYTDPRIGEEAALSEFDAKLAGTLLFQKNDKFFNNQFIGNEGTSQQDLARYDLGLTKLAATGTRFAFNHVTDYDFNNAPSNRFNDRNDRSRSYNTYFEAFVRQPLFQGRGVNFNRIAGPNNAPGVNNGVLIARANTDIVLAEFESQLRDLVSNVENAYWDLYFAYRDLEAKIEARNGAYKIWQNLEANKGDKSAAIIGQAKEQYFRFAAEVEDAIQGRPVEGTRTYNGSSSGTFRRSGGVRVAERRLRLIIGIQLNGDRLLVPSDMPVDVTSVFDWEQARDEALALRPELRRQRWKMKRQELELLANKNHLLPRLDLIGKYRLQGFGHNLFGDGNELDINGTVEQQLDSSAFGTLLNGNLQEWELGVDMSVPIGFRKQFAAVRNSEILLARETAVLKEQERQVIYGLSNAIGELNRSNRVRAANINRLDAANEQFAAINNIYREQDTTIDLVLEAQRRVIESKLQYFQTQVETMLAIKAVHFEKGTLFDYHNITLSEAPSSSDAQWQAINRDRRTRPKLAYTIPGLIIGEPKSGIAADEMPAVPRDAWSQPPTKVKTNPAMKSEIQSVSAESASSGVPHGRPVHPASPGDDRSIGGASAMSGIVFHPQADAEPPPAPSQPIPSGVARRFSDQRSDALQQPKQPPADAPPRFNFSDNNNR